MRPNPPAWADRFLRWALGDSAEAGTIRGDLLEDFARILRDRGPLAARLWYWREALGIGVGVVVSRSLFPSTELVSVNSMLSRNGLFQDAQYAARATRRDPGFFVFATAIIALGIGAATAVFSVMSPLLLRPLPFDAPEELVVVDLSDAQGAGLSAITSRTSNVRDLRERASSFEAVAGFNAFFEQGSYNMVGDGAPERLIGVEVTDNFVDVLGVQMALGRDFMPEEGMWDGPRAVMLQHGFWIRRFGGDRSVIGTAISLNDTPFEIVGVLPADFDFSSVFAPATEVDVLFPWPIADETDRWGNTTTMIARLSQGRNVEVAQAEVTSIMEALSAEDPNRWGLGGAVSGLQERIARPFRSGMLLLAAAASALMLIVCVNLSNMLLARSPKRKREMAVRRAMGATRERLVRQLLIESVLVSLAGAIGGAALAMFATGFVRNTTGLEIPMLAGVSVDGLALLFTVGIAVAAGLLVGAVPALQIAEGQEASAAGGSARGSSGNRGAKRFREILVVSEVAMACVLLVFSGLVVKSFQQVMAVDLGFESEQAIAWQISTAREFESLAEANAFYDEVVGAVEAVPGVTEVGLVDALPLGRQRTWGTRVVGVEYTDEDLYQTGFFPHIVDFRYLDAMRIPLVEGRQFTPDDNGESARVAIVNESAARTMFPNGEAVGQFITQGPEPGTEIIGVVGDVRHVGLDVGFANEIYFPMMQVWDFNTPDLVVRSTVPTEEIEASVSGAIRSVDAYVPTEDRRTLDTIVETSVSPRRFTLQLLIAFSAAALLLAGLGIYGVLSYSVSERLPEIGIRMALGESATDVGRSVVGRTLVLSVIGVVIGSMAAVTLSRLVESMLFGVEATDPSTFAGMITVLLVVAFLSGLVPAIRAARTSSVDALRAS